MTNYQYSYTAFEWNAASESYAIDGTFSFDAFHSGWYTFGVGIAPNSSVEITAETYASGYDWITSPVPEPSSLGLLGLGGIGLAFGIHRRRHAIAA